MNRAALILLLWPLSVLAGTFELSDPAAEIYKEQQTPPESKQAEEKLQIVDELFCAVDEKEGKCWCVHKETAKVVALEHEQCLDLASGISSSEP
jgi:hypothetical protein